MSPIELRGSSSERPQVHSEDQVPAWALHFSSLQLWCQCSWNLIVFALPPAWLRPVGLRPVELQQVGLQIVTRRAQQRGQAPASQHRKFGVSA